MEKKPSQLERLLKALQDHPQGITNIWIVQNLYCLNYKARITELRQGRLNHTPYNIIAIKPASGNVWRYILKPQAKESYKSETTGQLIFNL